MLETWSHEGPQCPHCKRQFTADEAKVLVERLRWGEWYFEDPFDGKAYASDDPLDAADLIETQAREIERLRGALGRFISWGHQQCPCKNEQPNPCPLCFASAENLEACKAVEALFPPDILRTARAALGESHDQ